MAKQGNFTNTDLAVGTLITYVTYSESINRQSKFLAGLSAVCGASVVLAIVDRIRDGVL